MIPDDHHVVLVGLMGTGKTTVGRVLAERLGRQLFDSDAMIESSTGETVRDIFAEQGEQAFRALETAALLEALEGEPPAVIAAAGGVVISDANRFALKQAPAKVVWLMADPATLVDRVRNGMHRPALDGDAEGELRRMHESRHLWYREVADMIVSVDGRSINEVADAVLR